MGLVLSACVSTQAASPPPSGFNPTRHIRVSEVEPGMRGYGMSVFAGTEPEPFPIEVVSVEHGFQPDMSVVWVRCTGPRMQLTGPVQGMSGSPIYIWPKDKEGEPVARKIGEGGRILGAFAFGFRQGKDCYVGVQPIEHMLEAASRARPPSQHARAGAAGVRDKMLAAAFELARRDSLDEQQTWRLKAISDLVGFTPSSAPAATTEQTDPRQAHLALPVALGSPEHAAALEPFYRPFGLATQAAAPMAQSNLAPRWIDRDANLKPGGTFAIPMVMGPLDIGAIGTTTEVLPDGTVLAFGHQFMAQGDIHVPMAPGYVHFIQPNTNASFKLGGSLGAKGSVIRDESSAVVGRPGLAFPTIPVNVHVRWGEPSLNRDFEYQVMRHDQMLPSLVATTVLASMMERLSPPRPSTLSISGAINFEGDRSLVLNAVIPNSSTSQTLATLIPPVASMVDNEFVKLDLTSVDVTLKIEATMKAAALISATIEQSVIEPGQIANVHVRLKAFRGDERLLTIPVRVPPQTPNGQYTITIGGARTFYQQRLAMRPHLRLVHDIDELFASLNEIMKLDDNAIYATLALPTQENLAVGRSELPNLPTSRLAMLSVRSSTRTSTYVDSVDVIQPLPYTVLGQAVLPIVVEDKDSANNER